MNSDLDLNAVAADASAQLAKDFLRATFSRAASTARFAYETLFSDFARHLAEVHQRVSQVKILTSKDVPVDFSKIYISASYQCGDRTYSDKQLVEIVLSKKRCVVAGNGGAGKTFMMRQMWLEIVRQKLGQAPILVELRKLNALSSYNIENFIRVNSFGAEQLSERAFEYFCREGSFVFLLDGFDEVLREKRDDLERQILALAKKYKGCGLVVSGRPDDRFDAWNGFYTFRAAPFEFEQFRSLIEKVPFDVDTKKSFLAVAKESFFYQHQSFLSNPLLALMMLLTFRDNAEIPSRVSSFYENCFATLYAQHDALKESFNRRKSLDQLRFKRVFAAFCFITYRDTKTSLDGAELIEAIERAKKIADVQVSNDDVQHDFLESVNLLVKDGVHYTFIHRSFQEFFAAYCAAYVLSEKVGLALSLFARRRYDSTLRLTYELHQGLVERELIIPKYTSLNSSGKLTRRLSKLSPYEALVNCGFSIDVVYLVGDKFNRPLTRPFSAKFNWEKEYGDLDAGIAASAEDWEGGGVDRLENNMATEVLKILWPPKAEFDMDIEEDTEIYEFRFSFSSSGVVATKISANKSTDGANELPESSDLVEKFMTIAPKLEKIVIENNKNLVSACERIIRKSKEDEDLIGLDD